MTTTTTCRSCGAEIIWARSARAGKIMPLDVAETEAKPGAMYLRDGRAWPFVRVPVDQHSRGTWHLSHFATCKDADDWRHKR